MVSAIKKTSAPVFLLLFFLLAGFGLKEQIDNTTDKIKLTDEDSVWDLYEKLGKIKINQVNSTIAGVSAEKGKNLITTGSSLKQNNKGRTGIQSPYFKCTACHNTKKEFSDLSDISSQNRLDYAEENDLPFLQGSSFYGLINRVSYYNDDYQKKYGHIPIIKASNTDLRSAIQLCATQCSQGRELDDWEIESVIAYFWSLGIKVQDLILSKEHKSQVAEAINTKSNQSEAIQILDAQFMDKSPAHFSEDKPFEKMEHSVLEDKQKFLNGAKIYERSCLHCHKNKRYSFFSLDKSKYSFTNLMTRTKAGGFGSIHKITRHGTWPLAGKRAYMPLYPIEKLSEEQLVDLRIYIQNMSEGNNLSKN